jgi:hypothetical protein
VTLQKALLLQVPIKVELKDRILILISHYQAKQASLIPISPVPENGNLQIYLANHSKG